MWNQQIIYQPHIQWAFSLVTADGRFDFSLEKWSSSKGGQPVGRGGGGGGGGGGYCLFIIFSHYT